MSCRSGQLQTSTGTAYAEGDDRWRSSAWRRRLAMARLRSGVSSRPTWRGIVPHATATCACRVDPARYEADFAFLYRTTRPSKRSMPHASNEYVPSDTKTWSNQNFDTTSTPVVLSARGASRDRCVCRESHCAAKSTPPIEQRRSADRPLSRVPHTPDRRRRHRQARRARGGRRLPDEVDMAGAGRRAGYVSRPHSDEPSKTWSRSRHDHRHERARPRRPDRPRDDRAHGPALARARRDRDVARSPSRRHRLAARRSAPLRPRLLRRPRPAARLRAATQTDLVDALSLGTDGPTRRSFPRPAPGRDLEARTIDVLRNGVKHGPHHVDLFYGTPSPDNAKAVELSRATASASRGSSATAATRRSSRSTSASSSTACRSRRSS